MNKIKEAWNKITSPIGEGAMPPLSHLLLDSFSAILAAFFFTNAQIVRTLKPDCLAYIMAGIYFVLGALILLGLLLRSQKHPSFFNITIRCNDTLLFPMLYGIAPAMAVVELLNRLIETQGSSPLIWPFFFYMILFIITGCRVAFSWKRKDIL